MILRHEDHHVVYVRQTDHQAQCLLMARAWGGREVERLARWPSIETAAALHDEGWRAVEDDPGPHATVDFARISHQDHVVLYERGIAIAEKADPYAGLLVSMHGQGLHQARHGLDGPVTPAEALVEPIRTYVLAQMARQNRIVASLGDDMELAVWRWDAYRLLQVWDRLSLYLVWRGLPDGREGRIAPVPRRAGDDGVALLLEPIGRHTVRCEPFPFDAAEVVVPIVERRVRGDVGPLELPAALAEAGEEVVEYVICRRPGR